MVAVPPATSRRPNHSLPLLPSGPGGICKLSSRENQRDRRETGGEGGIRTREAGISRLHTFQACSFNHSDTSPHACNQCQPPYGRDMLVSSLRLAPRYARGQLRCPNSFPTNLSNPRSGYKPLTHFPGVLLQPLGHLSGLDGPCLTSSMKPFPLTSCLALDSRKGCVTSR